MTGQQPIIVSITDGELRFLVSPSTVPFMTELTNVRRASHVEPVNIALRLCFYALRFVFGDKGKASDFTRNWNCIWRVNLSPINGEILPETFRDRKEAIAREVEFLNQNFI